ncbi:hypothetical protein [Achromobacter sp. DH1f]|uniref:hypothetical protein n=1 Tax=Achromobacter sp. DH1f TaxID=1397275 RepID=UPI0004685C82|nr:hypothetical protein [Achromobacter sp. DH1f]
MITYTFHQLGENLPNLQAESNTEYGAALAIRDRIGGGQVHRCGKGHDAISSHCGTGLSQIMLMTAGAPT